jgi:hypothetical protein
MDELQMHPTVKPVGLVADAIRDCSKRGDLVLDPFCGSGTIKAFRYPHTTVPAGCRWQKDGLQESYRSIIRLSHQKAATGVNGDGLRFVAVRLTVNQRQLHTWTRRNRQPYGVITRRRTK